MNQTPESTFPIEISVTEVKRLLDSGDLLLIDCREQSEYDQCRIDGSVLIPMNETGIDAWSVEVDPSVARY